MKIYHLTNTTESQMLGMLIQTDNGKVIAIDGGEVNQSAEVYRILKKLGLRVDMWFMTHPHSDHFTSIVEVLNAHDDIKVEGIWHSTVAEYGMDNENKMWYDFIAQTDIPVHELSLDDKFIVDNITIDVLGVANPEMTKDDEFINNQSIVLKISDGDFKLLILGDLAIDGGKKLLENHKDDIRCDAVQMAHHGQNGVEREVYEAIGAKYAFWSTPTWLGENRWPNDDKIAPEIKTIEVRGWMEELNTINITAFEHTVMFDTITKEIITVS